MRKQYDLDESKFQRTELFKSMLVINKHFSWDICSFCVHVLTVSGNFSSETKMRKALSGIVGLELEIKRLKGLKHTAKFPQWVFTEFWCCIEIYH